MKNSIIIFALLAVFMGACAFDESDVTIQDESFPYRLQIDEEGADLPDAEDYGVEISFADYLGDLPSESILLTYELSGEDDFSGVAIDEIIYEYEDDGGCVYEREIVFDQSTITVPVDADFGTVPEAFEILVAFNLADEASSGGFELQITGIQTNANVLFSDANTFEYGILDNEAAGSWVVELDENSFADFQEVFGPVSQDLAALTFADISGELVVEFGFEEVKFELELNEEEEVSECENGETETSMEALIVEIEAEYDAEDGEVEFEGSYYTEDGEELDFILEAEYALDNDGNIDLIFGNLIDEDNYEEGEELYSGNKSFKLIKD